MPITPLADYFYADEYTLSLLPMPPLLPLAADIAAADAATPFR
jgi:hypothetical protein